VLAAFNVGLWIWIASSAPLRTRHVQVQLVLSAIYVGVCGFRALFPRVDLERVCLWDCWLSGILVGRTAATIAEVCFALQCGLFVQQVAHTTGLPLLAAGARAFVPLVVLAELACWYAVLSLNNVGHAIEESLWALLMVVLSAAFATAAAAGSGPLRVLLVTGFLVYAAGAVLTMAFDVRMYVRRWRLSPAGLRLDVATGLRDSRRRRHPTASWEVFDAFVTSAFLHAPDRRCYSAVTRARCGGASVSLPGGTGSR
jgi:hypothetical protein